MGLGFSLTLLLSQKDLPKNWQTDLLQRIPLPNPLHLFLLDQATHLLDEDFSPFPPGQRFYCAHSHRQLYAPPPPKQAIFQAGSLFDLGQMIRQSHDTLSLPNRHGSIQNRPLGLKNIAILLGEEPNRQKESLRLATGLAGCNHSVGLYSPLNDTELRAQFPDALPLLDALHAMNVSIKTINPPTTPSKNPPIVLQL